LALLMCAACRIYDPARLGASPTRASVADEDTGTGACTSRPERCNGEDDDCDGLVDEEADRSCERPHSTTRCLGGACVLDECEPGHLNCNLSAADGCEKDMHERACGECGRTCDIQRAEGVAMNVSTPMHEDVDAGSPKVDERPQPDHDADAGSGCGPDSACGAKPDNPCAGANAGSATCVCLAAKPSSQTADCDRCACDQCAPAVAECFTNRNADWVSECSGVTHCYGVNIALGRCANADCGMSGFGVCAREEARSSSWGNWAYSCSPLPGAPRTPCDASVYLRQCMRDRCASLCTFGER
jgi:hypothetical protein